MNKELIFKIQQNEMTEHVVYQKLAALVKNPEHKKILERISREEIAHYETFKGLTQKDAVPDKFKVFLYVTLSRFLGLNFGLKFMESCEIKAQDLYESLKESFPEIGPIIRDEETHEKQIISLIDEESLKYVSSMVLGLNDALVELTGALAGFTLALQNPRLIGMVGLITGLAASMSMASAEYLSTKHEDTDKNPLKASLYTGVAYVGTVVFLIAPYFLVKNLFLALGFTLVNALAIMFVFTFYISVAKEMPFRRRFLEMSGLSLGIASISFFIGMAVRHFFHVDI